MITYLLAMQVVQAKDFYLSPLGNDSHPGTQEKPLKSIKSARGKVREWNQPGITEDITIWLADGEYRLTETLVFGLEDAANPGQSISYSALPGAHPVINSDVDIVGWKKVVSVPQGLPANAIGHVWAAPVPRQVMDFKTFYDQNGMLPRARTKAIAHMRKYDEWVGPQEVHTTIPFQKGATEKLFYPENAEIVVVPVAPWTMNILPVKSVDHATGMVHLGASSTYALAAPRFYMGAEAIWVENTFAGLDAPGKWVFDARERMIYYWPIDSEKPGDDLVVPTLVEMIRIEGEVDYDGDTDIPVKGLQFDGLTFNHGDRFESAGRTGSGIQHDWECFDAATALVRFRGAEDCSVLNCTFVNSGGAAVRLDLFAQRNRIEYNEISMIGGAGILMVGYGPGTKDVNKFNSINNNYIHHVGELWWHSPAIWAWQSGHNSISHNTIHNVPYSAILVTGRILWDRSGLGECSKTVRWNEVGDFTGRESWEERERFLHARQNTIANNDIHHVMDVMQDGNGIYISGTGHGNFVKGNYVHDTPSMAAGEAIRCDDDQHEAIIESNVIFRYGTHGIGICSKGRNHIFNNIVACPPHRVNRGMLSLEPTSGLANSGSRIFNNIFYATQSQQPFVFIDGIKKVIGTVDIDKNIYFNQSDSTAAKDYLGWVRQFDREVHSIEANPLFLDVENGNFQLAPNSPAFNLGFRPFQLNAGVIDRWK